jgi:hypothetical protein
MEEESSEQSLICWNNWFLEGKIAPHLEQEGLDIIMKL